MTISKDKKKITKWKKKTKTITCGHLTKKNRTKEEEDEQILDIKMKCKCVIKIK